MWMGGFLFNRYSVSNSYSTALTRLFKNPYPGSHHPWSMRGYTQPRTKEHTGIIRGQYVFLNPDLCSIDLLFPLASYRTALTRLFKNPYAGIIRGQCVRGYTHTHTQEEHIGIIRVQCVFLHPDYTLIIEDFTQASSVIKQFMYPCHPISA